MPESEALFPKIHLYESKVNTGFVGNNIGMKYALDSNFDYVFLLNADTVVDPDFLNQAVASGEKDKGIGAVQSFLMLWPDKNFVNSLGNKIHFLGFGYSFGYRWSVSQAEKYFGKSDNRDIAYASGAAVLYRAAYLRDVGFFDEKFFLYHEDLDLSWRLRMLRANIVISPNSIVFHKYEFSRSILKYYFMERNRLIFLFKNFQISTLVLISPALLVMELGLLLFALKSGFWRDKLRAYVFFLDYKNWQYILKERKKVQGSRATRDRELFKWLSGAITFQDIDSPLLTYLVNPIFSLYWWLVKKLILWWTNFLENQKKEPEF